MAYTRFPRLVYNKTSLAGLFLAVVTGVTIGFFLWVQTKIGSTNPYMGIMVYMVLPPFLLLGLLLVPIGMVRRWKFIRKHGPEVIPRWPQIDFNKKAHRNAFIAFIAGGFFFLVLTTVGAYQAYHYTESVTFCGQTCHQVMHPEFTAYQISSHARVACVECHVGAGAGWYAKSKLSGAYQVYATAFNKYPRPIPTPVKNLRPAQETCEQCHWPERFYGSQQRQFNHYMYDDENTPWPISMLVKTGGGNPLLGQTAGIHWHMNIGVDVEYISRDERRQDIPWVQVTDRETNRVTVYQSKSNPLTAEEQAAAVPRRMDCIDCHSRPSHKYRSPDYSIDEAISTGQIDRTLPGIKRAAVAAMSQQYDTSETATQGIAASIEDFYRKKYPDIFETRRVAIDEAILATQKQFSLSIFPTMKVKWSDYPDNIGHFVYPGCMRCHNGDMVSQDGWVLTRDCKTCHAILSEGSGERARNATEEKGLDFEHPEDIGGEWQETGCYECHGGTQP